MISNLCKIITLIVSSIVFHRNLLNKTMVGLILVHQSIKILSQHNLKDNHSLVLHNNNKTLILLAMHFQVALDRVRTLLIWEQVSEVLQCYRVKMMIHSQILWVTHRANQLIVALVIRTLVNNNSKTPSLTTIKIQTWILLIHLGKTHLETTWIKHLIQIWISTIAAIIVLITQTYLIKCKTKIINSIPLTT